MLLLKIVVLLLFHVGTLESNSPPKKNTDCVETTTKTTITSTKKPADYEQQTCHDDADCPQQLGCVRKCDNGMNNMCVRAVCVDSKCTKIPTCTQKTCKADEDCPILDPKIVSCPLGYGPTCEKSKCANGLCKWIKPCSEMSQDPQMSTRKPGTYCTKPSECPRVHGCVEKCNNGFNNTCVIITCINNTCGTVPPCFPPKCKSAMDCPARADTCRTCPPGYGPPCGDIGCMNGYCVWTQPCNEMIEEPPPIIVIRPPPCESSSQCRANRTACQTCPADYGPPCDDASCDNGKCKAIKACSQKVELPPPGHRKIGMYCEADNDCEPLAGCVQQCSNGMDNNCVKVVCRDHKCASIPPCTQKSCKMDKDCPVNTSTTITCPPGYGPTCEKATCMDGLCKWTKPCSEMMQDQIMVTKTVTQYECSVPDDCPKLLGCVQTCENGMGNPCVIVTCINHKCGSIPPCTQKSCRSAADCPVAMNACRTCEHGYGPSCDDASCDNGKCKLVKACSQKVELPPPGHRKIGMYCEADNDCEPLAGCVQQCSNGMDNNCVKVVCRDHKCTSIPPCTQKSCKMDKDCPVNTSTTITCPPGYGPTCEKATCMGGRCKWTKPCSEMMQDQNMVTKTVTQYECSVPDDCPKLLGCVQTCENGMGNPCVIVTCINHKCGSIPPCTQKSCRSAADCPVTLTACRTCEPGYGPSCDEALCEDGMCKMVKACSKMMKVSTLTVPMRETYCKSKEDCSNIVSCVDQCDNGMNNHCGEVVCLHHRCITIPPCSQRTCKTADDCPVDHDRCETCDHGYGPPCEETICEEGVCKWISPCSDMMEVPSTTLSSYDSECDKDSDCPEVNDCVRKCRNGLSNTCARVACVHQKCITIPACGRHSCSTSDDCPVRHMNCNRCRRGYGPSCETATCEDGCCQWTKPCSKSFKRDKSSEH